MTANLSAIFKTLDVSLILEGPDQPKGGSAQKFKSMHVTDEEYMDPASAEFWDRLRQEGDEAMLDWKPKRPADKTPMETMYQYDNLFAGEEVIGHLENSPADRVSILRSSKRGPYKYKDRLLVVMGNNTRVVSNSITPPDCEGSRGLVRDLVLRSTGRGMVYIDRIGNDDYDDHIEDHINTGMSDEEIKKKKIFESTSPKAGGVTLKDGTKVTLNKADADKLKAMFDDLSPANKKKMGSIMMADKVGFDEILSFAKEADD